MIDTHIVVDTSHTKQMQNTETSIADEKLVEIKTLKCNLEQKGCHMQSSYLVKAKYAVLSLITG